MVTTEGQQERNSIACTTESASKPVQQQQAMQSTSATESAVISEDATKSQAQHSQLIDNNGPDLVGFTNQVVNTLREWYVLASDSITNILEGRLMQQLPKDLWLLGRRYELAAVQQGDQGWTESSYPSGFVDDFSHLIWCTYRSQYPPIAPSAFTTDAGWGCMLRAGQTLLAQALQLHYFGRDWSFSWENSLDENMHKRKQYVEIVKQFFDDYSSTSVFSIHRMASFGKQFEGKDIGQWFGPYGTASIIRKLAQEANHELAVYTTTDGVVYLADICGKEFRPTLILVASMLGIDRVNPVYYPFIQASLTLPQSAGIAGGKPSSALYFAGFQGDELFYLDPHYTRPAITHHSNSTPYESVNLATYSCSTPRRIPLSRLDPCMVFGYYCGTLESLIDLRSRIDLLADDGMKTIMTFNSGHSPAVEGSHSSGYDSSVLSTQARSPDKNTVPISENAQKTGGESLIELLSSSDTDNSGIDVASGFESGHSNSSGHRSESSEVVLEGDAGDDGSNEEEWVTDM
ncbi:Cysteine protease atg4 [Coemansia spiralis]|uniref:Cysteine protease n=2 Tax=Coemansia TaxID=4863 RepID=A0A9W8G9V5_9FUNG|nr:hypothetical protein BX070DRAFT_225226 [Coemansia spiralis]KAJ1987943.1 Cysteine protease atg4 [Coemansia umbellata]KAJ2622299.1 Cysteine protease atg4 [Coemansia sp. RSA 1358]KAJ2677902.1 Cysteine protease atg4 [Coemansia spiralis]